MDPEQLKKIGMVTAVFHLFEALLAVRVARKRGKSPVKYFILTLMFGVLVLVPLIRKPKLEASE